VSVLWQYDMALGCFERALSLANDSNMADVWCVSCSRVPPSFSLVELPGLSRYNIGQVAVAIGDVGLAYQAFKIAISVDNNHAESYCNLGVSIRLQTAEACTMARRSYTRCGRRDVAQVLEQRKQHLEAARAHFATAHTLGPHLFEPVFDGGRKPERDGRTSLL
jgi:tetratricopeptide repeat protein 8